MRVDKYTLATMNRCMVLETILEQKEINRAEIARLTSLSIPTIIKITCDLVDANLVRPCGRRESESGKRPEMYEFAGDTFYSIGVDIAPTKIRIVLMDLSGTVISQTLKRSSKPWCSDEIVTQVVDAIQQILEASDIQQQSFLGIGIGVPGILDMEAGTVIFSPNFQWENVALVAPIRQLLWERTNRNWNIHLENTNRALAVGEQYFGAGVGFDYFICINLGYGIGSAVIQSGQIYTGSSGTSGEVGHITVERDGPLCTCGNSGCLEALASGRAIAQQARNLIGNGVSTLITTLCNGKTETIDAKMVFDAARQGDTAALELVRKAAEYIGIGIASYINLLDPEKIILAGGMTKDEYFVAQIERVVNVRRMRFAGRRVTLKVSQQGDYATAVGAGALILKELLITGDLPKRYPFPPLAY